MEAKDINMELVEDTRSILCDKFPKIIEFFLEDTEGYIVEAEEGLKNNNPDLIINSTHTIKSSSYQVGAEKLSLIAKEMEEIAREVKESGTDHQSHLEELYLDLATAFAKVKPLLEELKE